MMERSPFRATLQAEAGGCPWEPNQVGAGVPILGLWPCEPGQLAPCPGLSPPTPRLPQEANSAWQPLPHLAPSLVYINIFALQGMFCPFVRNADLYRMTSSL